MIEKIHIEKLVNEFINGTEIFLVAVRVSSANKITILADTMKGITIDECAAIHRHIEKSLDRDAQWISSCRSHHQVWTCLSE